jgi:NADH-quinone oxidoreductase subunit L
MNMGLTWVQLIWLVPLLPFLSFLTLFLTQGRLPRPLVGVLGAGSVGLAALVVGVIATEYLGAGNTAPVSVQMFQWMNVGGLNPSFGFIIDGLSITMLCVITGVGFLIHVYSTLFVLDEKDYSRFFTYMNLFVSAMIILVLADNLLLLYLGWEGVGVCSYLLIGYWYEDASNGRAARKAFIVTRIGDGFMALGMLLLFTHLGTLEISAVTTAAAATFQTGDTIPTIAALLLLGGACGKSAQLPLQTWLPDAMAGPTPVSALIHAATMVTAGVYLIARMHDLFLLAPVAQLAVAFVGLLTLLVAAGTALTQNDIKRILAYSTISQIGYMFLALGVGAWSAAIFHLMTHAFFKALLFLGAGYVVYSLHHEHDIRQMGGLARRLPIGFASFLIGSAALAALPMTSGFFSKDEILLAAYEHGEWGGLLWAGGALGAFLTALYSFRLVFIVFLGPTRTEPSAPAGWLMGGPLLVLCVLSLVGGFIDPPAALVLPASPPGHDAVMQWVTPAIPIVGVVLAWFLFSSRSFSFGDFATGPGGALRRFLYSHWAMDWLYDRTIVRPYYWLARINRSDAVDYVYAATAGITRVGSSALALTQSGQLRWYAGTMVGGLVIFVAILLGIL